MYALANPFLVFGSGAGGSGAGGAGASCAGACGAGTRSPGAGAAGGAEIELPEAEAEHTCPGTKRFVAGGAHGARASHAKSCSCDSIGESGTVRSGVTAGVGTICAKLLRVDIDTPLLAAPSARLFRLAPPPEEGAPPMKGGVLQEEGATERSTSSCAATESPAELDGGPGGSDTPPLLDAGRWLGSSFPSVRWMIICRSMLARSRDWTALARSRERRAWRRNISTRVVTSSRQRGISAHNASIGTGELTVPTAGLIGGDDGGGGDGGGCGGDGGGGGKVGGGLGGVGLSGGDGGGGEGGGGEGAGEGGGGGFDGGCGTSGGGDGGGGEGGCCGGGEGDGASET